MSFYNKNKLLKVARDRGYVTFRAIADALAPIFDAKPSTVRYKVQTGKFTQSECEVIASYFEMTMREYYDVFMNGLFTINGQGRYVAHIENPYLHLHPVVSEEEKEKRRRRGKKLGEKAKQKRHIKTYQEILADLDEL